MFEINTTSLSGHRKKLSTDHWLIGVYPEVNQLLPSNNCGEQITLPVDSLKKALQQAAILSHEKFRAAELQFSKNTLTLSAHNTNQETIQNTLPIVYDKEALTMAFNITYLLDVLNALEQDTIDFTLLTEQNCAYIKEEVPDLGTKRYVIMSLTL